MPALAQSGVVDTAREVYGSIGPAFYGPRTMIVALVFLALTYLGPRRVLEAVDPTLARGTGWSGAGAPTSRAQRPGRPSKPVAIRATEDERAAWSAPPSTLSAPCRSGAATR